MYRSPLLRRIVVAFALVGLAAAFAPRISAQGLMQLKKDRSDHFTRLSTLKAGVEKTTAADKNALEAEARFLVLRFKMVQEPATEGKREEAMKDIAAYQREFTQLVDEVERSPEPFKKNRSYVQYFSPELVKTFKVLFDEDFQANRFAIVNTAPMLSQAARMRDEAIGLYLTDLVNAKDKHDLIKMYAARALREFFPVAPTEAGAVLAGAVQKRKDREVKYVDALVGFIERKPGDKLSEPEENAIRYLRREALESLAQTQAPALVTDKVNVEGPIAPTLLRVLASKGGIEPPPGLAERIEAAIGICQIKYAQAPDYQADLGTYLVGSFVSELATEYNKDLVLMNAKKQPMLTWKIHSKRLETALKDLAKNAKNQPAAAKAANFARDASELIKPMQTYSQINQNDLVRFTKMVTTLRPPDTEVYKGNKKFVIALD